MMAESWDKELAILACSVPPSPLCGSGSNISGKQYAPVIFLNAQLNQVTLFLKFKADHGAARRPALGGAA